MYFILLRRRENGAVIAAERLRKMEPLRVDIHIGIQHSEPLGRVCTQAWVFNPAPSGDIIPRLYDAHINGMAQLGMNITGLEEVDGVLYAQSWWCRTI